MPTARLPFPSIVVASTDDEYLTLPRAERFAADWGSRLEIVGALGHINSTSGLGLWPKGFALLDELRDLSAGSSVKKPDSVEEAPSTAASGS